MIISFWNFNRSSENKLFMSVVSVAVVPVEANRSENNAGINDKSGVGMLMSGVSIVKSGYSMSDKSGVSGSDGIISLAVSSKLLASFTAGS